MNVLLTVLGKSGQWRKCYMLVSEGVLPKKSIGKSTLIWLESFAGHPFYRGIVALAAAADVFILVVPNDALAVSAVLAKPKRWFSTSLIFALGSFSGGALLILLASINPEFLHSVFPSLFASEAWTRAEKWLEAYGFWAMLLGSVGPIPFQPVAIAGVMSGSSIPGLLLGLFLGRTTKYLAIGWLSHLTTRNRGEIKIS